MDPMELTVAQEDVYLLLGRCMVQAQVLELALKRLLAYRSIGGTTVEEIERQLDKNFSDYKTNTLGTLVKVLLQAFLMPDGTEHPELTEPDNLTEPFFCFRFGIQMAPDQLADLSQSLGVLVTVRNDLVHHLVERYPLRTVEGCRQAKDHLKCFASMLDTHRTQFHHWLSSWRDSAKAVSEFTQSEEFENLLDGIRPDGTIDWSAAGIVAALSEAAEILSAGAWTRLDAACAWIQREAPSQIPSRYGCSTYRQVIHESRAFDVKRESDAEGCTVFLYKPAR